MMARKSRKHVEEPAVYTRSFPPRTIGHHISVREFDFCVQQLIAEHISEVMVLRSKLASGNYTNHLWDQVVILQHEICEVDLQIKRQKFLIESLKPNVQKEIITLQESEELHLIFESRQSELMKVRNQLLEKVQWIRNAITSDCGWIKHFAAYAGQTIFSRKDIAMLVESIFLHKDKRIEICFVHDQEFQYIKQMLE